MADLKNIDDYLAGDVNLKDVDYLVVKAGDANFFQVTGGAHFFGVDSDSNSIFTLALGEDGKFVSADANGHKDVVAYIDNDKLQVVYGRHTDPYNGLSQPVTVTLNGTEDKGKALLNAFKGYANTWFNNLFVPRVKDISVDVAVSGGSVDASKVTSIDVSPYSSITGKVGDTFKIEPKVSPTTVTNKTLGINIADSTIISSANTDNSADGSFSLTAAKAGTTEIEIKATDGSGVSVKIPVTITEA